MVALAAVPDTSMVAAELAECERVIGAGLRAFVEVGRALARVRDSRLYRETHETFEAYCQDRWDFQASRARQLIGAAETVTNVTPLGCPVPTTESQARELSGLEPGEAQGVMEAAYKATGGRVTAKAIKAARREYEADEPDAPDESPTPRDDSDFAPESRSSFAEAERVSRKVHALTDDFMSIRIGTHKDAQAVLTAIDDCINYLNEAKKAINGED